MQQQTQPEDKTPIIANETPAPVPSASQARANFKQGQGQETLVRDLQGYLSTLNREQRRLFCAAQCIAAGKLRRWLLTKDSTQAK